MGKKDLLIFLGIGSLMACAASAPAPAGRRSQTLRFDPQANASELALACQVNITKRYPADTPASDPLHVDIGVRSDPESGASRFVVTRIKVGGMSDSEQERLQDTLLKASPKGHVAFTDRGKLQQLTLLAPSVPAQGKVELGLEKMLSGLFLSLQISLDALGTPLPLLAVAQGDRWETPSKTLYNDFELIGRAEIELVALDEQSATLTVRATMARPAGPVQALASKLPEGVILESASAQAKETATFSLDVKTGALRSGTVEITLDTEIRILADGKRDTSNVSATLRCTTGSRPD